MQMNNSKTREFIMIDEVESNYNANNNSLFKNQKQIWKKKQCFNLVCTNFKFDFLFNKRKTTF